MMTQANAPALRHTPVWIQSLIGIGDGRHRYLPDNRSWCGASGVRARAEVSDMPVAWSSSSIEVRS